MEVDMSQLAVRAAIAIAAGMIGSILYVLLSTEDSFRMSVRKFVVGCLASGVFTGIVLRYVNLDATQMDVWIAGAAAVGFSAYILLGVALKKLTKWAADWNSSPSTLPAPPTPPTPPVPPPATVNQVDPNKPTTTTVPAPVEVTPEQPVPVPVPEKPVNPPPAPVPPPNPKGK